MGLDMYLNAEIFISEYKDEDKKLIENLNKLFPYKGRIRPYSIKFEAAYWRKANMIHKWFVDNVQEGKDDCGYYEVSIKDLQDLLTICKNVQEDHTLAEKLLPPQSGFFFGGTDMDEWYWIDINGTIEKIENVLSLEELDNLYFEYHSSW